MEKKMNNKGFSLVELIIVIAIMAILGMVLANMFLDKPESAKETTDLQNFNAAKQAVEVYATENTSTNTFTVELSATGLAIKDGTDDITDDLPGMKKDQKLLGTWDKSLKSTFENFNWTDNDAKGKAYDITGAKIDAKKANP